MVLDVLIIAGVNETEVLAKIATQMELLTREVRRNRMDWNSMHASVNQISQGCEHCSGQHTFGMCPFADVNNLPMEHAQVVGSFPRPNNPYSNTYNPRVEKPSKRFLEKRPAGSRYGSRCSAATTAAVISARATRVLSAKV